MLTNEQLATLTDRLAQQIASLRTVAIPGMSEQVEMLEQTFACLRELEAWRRTHPGQSMTRTFNSGAYGTTVLQ